MTMQRVLPLTALLFLSGCVTLPEAPSVLVLPGSGKSFAQFSADDATCRQFARYQAGGSAEQAATSSAVTSAAAGTALGAAAGAALGGGRGAAVGAGTGLVFGSAAGTGAAASSTYEAQLRYDHSYVQCMYALGHRVPVAGQFLEQPGDQDILPAPARPVPPPPRSGPPPSPPPDVR